MSNINTRFVLAFILGGHVEGGPYGCGTWLCDAISMERQDGAKGLAAFAAEKAEDARKAFQEIQGDPVWGPFFERLEAAIETAVASES